MLSVSKPFVTFIGKTEKHLRRRDISCREYSNKIPYAFTWLCLLLIILLSSCLKKDPHLSGTVIAKDSGQPILNVQVQIEGSDFIVKTNVDGYYSYSKIPADFRLIFKHADFDSVVVDAVDMKQGRSYRIDVSLNRKAHY